MPDETSIEVESSPVLAGGAVSSVDEVPIVSVGLGPCVVEVFDDDELGLDVTGAVVGPDVDGPGTVGPLVTFVVELPVGTGPGTSGLPPSDEH